MRWVLVFLVTLSGSAVVGARRSTEPSVGVDAETAAMRGSANDVPQTQADTPIFMTVATSRKLLGVTVAQGPAPSEAVVVNAWFDGRPVAPKTCGALPRRIEFEVPESASTWKVVVEGGTRVLEQNGEF